MFIGFGDVKLHAFRGDAQPLGNLPVGQIFTAAHEEDAARLLRQFGQCLGHQAADLVREQIRRFKVLQGGDAGGKVPKVQLIKFP